MSGDTSSAPRSGVRAETLGARIVGGRPGESGHTNTAPRVLQWCPSGNPLDGMPENMARFLASADGKTRGYGHGPGWSMGFGTEHGHIYVRPGEWVVRHSDGRITVEDHDPATPADDTETGVDSTR